jgi:ribosome-associated protein
MKTHDLQTIVSQALEDLKANDITILDVHELTNMTDVMFFCSGRSSRHVRSIAENVVKIAKQNHVQPLGIEGKDAGEWVLIDIGNVVVHIMLPAIRDFYQIEQLWTTSTHRNTSEAHSDNLSNQSHQ